MKPLHPHSLLSNWLRTGRVLLVLSLSTIPGWSQSETNEAHDHDNHDEHEEGIHLEDRDILEFGVTKAIAGPGSIHKYLRAPGEILMNENATAHVAPRFAAVTKVIYRRLGDQVQSGERLATMEANDTLRPFDLTSPIDGTIIDFHMTMGESLEAGQYAYIVADTSTVWVDLKIYQRDLPKVRLGQRVSLHVGNAYPVAEGTISYIGPTVDETTRTGLARFVLPNPGGIYLPGMFITGDILLEEKSHPVVVPLSAIHTLHEEQFVYITLPGGDGFAAREVTITDRDKFSAALGSGLQAGEEYVSAGGFHLKAESQKEAFGDGHGH